MINVTKNELARFAIVMGTAYIDEFIPIPDTPKEEQKQLVSEHEEHNPDDLIYWETETYSHGWCCAVCGKVIQWG